MDAYEVIGVKRTATDKEIADAYKRKSREYHPDHGGSPEKMSELNLAYSMIKTPALRKEYDAKHSFSAEFDMLSKVFGKPSVAANFGNKPVDDKSVPGTDIDLSVNIPIHVFVNGYPRLPLVYTRDIECLECSGTGAKRFCNCSACGGVGYTVTNRRRKKCRKCSGTGIVILEKCSECNGGYNRKSVTTEIVYRKHTETMVLPGRGNMGKCGGASGKLNVKFIPVSSDGISYKNGKLTVTGIQVWPEDLVLGSVVDVTIAGRPYHVTIPADGCPAEFLVDHDIPAELIPVVRRLSEDSPGYEYESELYKKLAELHGKK